MDRLLDTPQNGTLDRLKDALPEGEEELIRVQADLDGNGDFGNQWVVDLVILGMDAHII